MPDETTVLRFRYLLEKNKLAPKIMATIQMKIMNVSRLFINHGIALLISACAGVATPAVGSDTVQSSPPINGDVGNGVRSIESMRQTFDRNRGEIYARYRREVKDNPQLKGRLVLKLQISSAGKVTDCLVASSQLQSVAFEAELISLCKQFDFGAVEQSRPTTVIYPLDFIPN